ncbi:hypothetical protein ACH5RR_021203 [Cinchona calisaya]|uniref:5'-3' exoribonuclease n=1 Tax=Cinchona calisaya TaxID=153742 RepID=A0ABD2ZHP0_9GENT
MGVPSFYRWLVNKYPKIVSVASEAKNPNGLEFDNLYLDMNGIIHPCFHPEDNLFPPTTFEDVFSNIYDYIDKLFNIVRPRKLLYMAIDGVAPRAKMNQQRSRRFRTAKDNEVAEEVENMFRKQFKMEGKKILPKEESELSDSNVITPGTEFMYLLSKKLQCYIKHQMVNDSRWNGIKVILSDANVPGEGEHKIMSFIRAQRCSGGYDPSTRHCLYGLDADLIMLVLATHEVHFSILREEVLVQEDTVNSISEIERSARKAEAYSGKCRGWFKQNPELVPEPGSSRHTPEVALGSKNSDRFNEDSNEIKRRAPVMKKHFQYLHVWLLREYLHIDMKISNPPENVKMDLERIIDDFIFICFFAGNDFLPHMPTLEIHERATDLLIHVYKEEFKNLGGYLVDIQRIEDKKGEYVKLKRVEKFILSVGEYEEKIFKKRSEIRDRKLRRIQSELSNAEDAEDQECTEVNLGSSLGSTDHAFHAKKTLSIMGPSTDLDEKLTSSSEVVNKATNYSEVLNNTSELKQKLKNYIRSQSDTFKNGGLLSDKVKLGVQGWRKRYYEVKFSAKTPEEMERTRKSLVEKYTEGLCWVLKYYFSGVPSWTWFYPYHYSPFASDLKGLTQVNVKFQKGQPLKPFDQLLAVLPPNSGHALPEVYKKLMVDKDSIILDFYPTSFQIDADGKRFMWQAICKVPFIQEDRLLAETRKAEKELKGHERERNAETADRLFASNSSGLGEQISSIYESCPSLNQNDTIKINNMLSDGVSGFMHLYKEKDQEVFCVFYRLPLDYIPIPHLVEGVNIPEKTITEKDIVETSLWHEFNGSAPHRVLFNQNHNLKSCPTNKEPEIIYKYAGIRWGEGRGKIDNSTVQTRPSPAFRSHAQCVGNSFSPSAARASTSASSLNWRLEKQHAQCAGNSFSPSAARTSTSASSLNWRFEKQLKTVDSYNAWSRRRNTEEGSWRNSSTSNNTSPSWRQSQPIYSSSTGKQAHGRGQYVPKTSTDSWNTRSRYGSNNR